MFPGILFRPTTRISNRKNYQDKFIDQQKLSNWKGIHEFWRNRTQKVLGRIEISPKLIPSESVLAQVMAMKQRRFGVYNMSTFRSCGICILVLCNLGCRMRNILPWTRALKHVSLEAFECSRKRCETFWVVNTSWSNYSDLTRPHPKWRFSKGNTLISGKSRLVKYYNLARHFYKNVCFSNLPEGVVLRFPIKYHYLRWRSSSFVSPSFQVKQ